MSGLPDILRKSRIERRAAERRLVTLTTAWYASGTKHGAVAFDRQQAATVLGILSQPRPERVATGQALAAAITKLRQEAGSWAACHRKTIGVSIRTASGIVKSAEHPIVGRVALLVVGLCFAEGAIEGTVRQLERFVAFGDVPFINVGRISEAVADLLDL